MSGGLDSTAVASLAAQMVAPRRLTTISYVFDRFPACDERPYINAVKEKYDLHSIQVPVDDALPFQDMRAYTPNRNEPNENVYRQVHHLAFVRAQAEGLRVLLHGGYGDHVYAAGREWLPDLLVDGQFRTAGRELRGVVKRHGAYRLLETRQPQRIARRLVDAIPGGWRLYRKSKRAPWLTEYAQGLLPPVERQHPATERNALMFGALAATQGSHFFFKAGTYNLELRSPYRDRRLIEFAAGLPAYEMYRGGVNKYVLRMALKNDLPEKIAARVEITSLLSFFSRGLEQAKGPLAHTYLQSSDAVWKKYVSQSWLSERWHAEVTPAQDGPQALVFWMCASFENWRNSFSNN
jgi:asparagine synthase (glutamine-hydrolysing)